MIMHAGEILRRRGLLSDEQLRRRQAVHREAFERRFPQLKQVPFEFGWSGVEGISRNGTNFFGQVRNRVFLAGGYNGSGVSRGTAFGTAIADHLKHQDAARTIQRGAARNSRARACIVERIGAVDNRLRRTEETLVFRRSFDQTCFGFQPGNPCARWTEVVGREEIEICTLDQWCRDNDISMNRVDILKLDERTGL